MKDKLIFSLKVLFTFFALIICFRGFKDGHYLFSAIIVLTLALVNLPKSNLKKRLIHITFLCVVITTLIQSSLIFTHYKKSQKLSLKDNPVAVREKIGLPDKNMKYNKSLDIWFIPFWLGGFKTTVGYTEICQRVNYKKPTQACSVEFINQSFHTLKGNHLFLFKKIRNETLQK